MKNRAYSLAEALIALLIMGLVAAIGIPQISIMAQKHQSKAIVAKMTYSIEAGVKEMLNDYNYETSSGSNIDKILLTGDNWENRLKSALSIQSNKLGKIPGEIKIETKQIPNDAAKYEFDTQVLKITIDTNGFDKKPNAKDVDVYEYVLTNGGIVKESNN